MKMIKALLMVTALLGLAACNSNKGGKHGHDGSNKYGTGDLVEFYGKDLSPEQERDLLAKRTYYFAYDSNEVNDEDTMSVYAHAKRMINSPRTKIRVEGHTDERGSREYNIALGERRGDAIADLLILKGVPKDQISVVSYGKEKPAVQGSDESAWSQNRRVVMVYEVE